MVKLAIVFWKPQQRLTLRATYFTCATWVVIVSIWPPVRCVFCLMHLAKLYINTMRVFVHFVYRFETGVVWFFDKCCFLHVTTIVSTMCWSTFSRNKLFPFAHKLWTKYHGGPSCGYYFVNLLTFNKPEYFLKRFGYRNSFWFLLFLQQVHLIELARFKL